MSQKAKLILVAIHGGINNDDDDAENVLPIMNWLWKMWCARLVCKACINQMRWVCNSLRIVLNWLVFFCSFNAVCSQVRWENGESTSTEVDWEMNQQTKRMNEKNGILFFETQWNEHESLKLSFYHKYIGSEWSEHWFTRSDRLFSLNR